MDIRGDSIQMGLKGVKGMEYVLPNDKGVINKSLPAFGFEMPRIKGSGFKVFHKGVSHYRRQGGSHYCSFDFLIDGAFKRQEGRVEANLIEYGMEDRFQNR